MIFKSQGLPATDVKDGNSACSRGVADHEGRYLICAHILLEGKGLANATANSAQTNCSSLPAANWHPDPISRD